MKKLMIAAAAAAIIGGAYAKDDKNDLCNEGIALDGCAVYTVKFKFKTLAGKDARCTAAQLGACGYDNDADGNADPIAYLDNATRTFDGILWQCQSACFEGVTPNEGIGAPINYVLWEKKAERVVSDPAIFTDNQDGTGTWTATDAAEEGNFAILGRYGKTANKVAAYWTPSMNAVLGTESINAAGFGTFDTKNLRIKKISGNAVAQLEPLLLTRQETCTELGYVSVMAYLCHDFRGWCCCDCIAATIVPASGTWSLSYNSSLSKGKKPLSQILPEYAYVIQ